MPKIVDHELQRESIADAALRIIQTNGIEHATVRKIAQEAGVCPSSLRHYFNNQAQLLEFSLRMVLKRIEARFITIELCSDSLSLEEAKKLLLQLIPVDKEQKSERKVWLCFSINTLHTPALKKMSSHTHRLMYKVIRIILERLSAAGLLNTTLDLNFEAQRLHTLIEGLEAHQLVYPDGISLKQIDDILTQHLKALLG